MLNPGGVVTILVWYGNSCQFGAMYLYVGLRICNIFSHQAGDLKDLDPWTKEEGDEEEGLVPERNS